MWASLNDTTFLYTGPWSTAPDVAKYLGDDHFSSTVGSTFTVTFTGSRLRLYSARASHHGIGAVSVDGGPESDIDFYGFIRQEQALVYTTPTLPSGIHTVSVRVTGRKNPISTGFVIAADRADFLAP
jgi:mannan endo-1,4-beta-mannosidase